MKLKYKSTSIFYLIPKLLIYLNKRRKIQLFMLLCFMIIGAFAEVISLGAVLPFLAILTTPETVFNYQLFQNAKIFLNITSSSQLILPITILFIFAALLAGIIRIALQWVTSRLTSAIGSELSLEVYKRILYQPYSVHISLNSSEVINNISNEVNGVVFGIILPFLNLLNSIFLLIVILPALIIINPFVALTSFTVFGISYFSIAKISRLRIKQNSETTVVNQTKTIKVLQESLGGIRDVILDGTHLLYSEIFRSADVPLRRAAGENNFLGQYPRYSMETIGIIMIAILAYFLSTQIGGVGTALPVLGALGVGSQRILPALQQIYNSWVSIVSNNNQLTDVMKILNNKLPSDLSQGEPLTFNNDINITNLYFKYSDQNNWVLDGINLNIKKGARVGFIGSTGTGKSTLLDVIMGLLIPNKGEIYIDGKCLSVDRYKSWQRNIAHVPQSIYLADTSFAENIAFGIPYNQIDFNRVKHAAQLSQIAEFIESTPKAYETFVGERGIQISGGQRQRIGIARALYKQADVLILDEATSALDTFTEQSVMHEISGLNRTLTVLIIAHRLTTLKDCDIIFELNKGKILRQGNYFSLIESNIKDER